MKWELAIVAATLLVVAGVSRRLTDTSFTPAMAFVLTGLVVGPLVIDQVTVAPASATVRTLAEATLAVVLFADASRIKLRALRNRGLVALPILTYTPAWARPATCANDDKCAPADPNACAHPIGPSGVQPSSWLTPGVLINVPITASEPPAVNTTRGVRESSSV